ncbi:MAG: hypothetical protein R3B13_04430 [Polyangiaceae bacterium]
MAESKVRAIEVLKACIAALERQIADMRKTTDVAVPPQEAPKIRYVPRERMPSAGYSSPTDRPASDFRLDNNYSLVADSQD